MSDSTLTARDRILTEPPKPQPMRLSAKTPPETCSGGVVSNRRNG
jgi:hypothetical protein